MPEIQIAFSMEQDVPEIFSLYKAVSMIEGGLARKQNGITEAYVQSGFAGRTPR